MLTIWTKDNCSNCLKAKSIMKSKGIEFKERKIGVDCTKEELLKVIPTAKTVPQFTVGNEVIGDYNCLLKYIDARQ